LLLNVSSALYINEGCNLRKRLRKNLSHVLSSEELGKVYNSFDVVGDIAIIRLPSASPLPAQTAAQLIMNRHRKVKTVLLQTSPVTGAFRLRRLTHVAGENKTRTVHREFGCLFSVDVEECYFSPRLSYERMRIAKMVEPNEIVVNMFAGVGCFSIAITKHANPAKVFSIDVNPTAIQFMQENVRLNRVYSKVIPLLGDSKELIYNRLQRLADRVLMPLPEKALEYLPFAVSALKASGGWIHYYSLEHAAKTENAAEKAKLKVSEALDALDVDFEVPCARVVRSTGPNWFQLAADVHIM
jgi:tRNA (guanine37-N1)-methyltransferase